MAEQRTNSFTDQIRQAIDDSGLTRYRIAKETGISESNLAQFYNGRRGLSMEALNALSEFLQLKITLGRKPGTERAELEHGEHLERPRRPSANPLRGTGRKPEDDPAREV